MLGIPFATTTIVVTRQPENADVDDYDVPTSSPITVASGVRAVIGQTSANDVLVGGERINYNGSMRCDPCDMEPGDTVTDSAGLVWTVLNVVPQQSFALSVYVVALRRVTGAGQI